MTPIAPQGHDSSPPESPTLCTSQGKPHHSPSPSIQPGLFQGAGLPQAPEACPFLVVSVPGTAGGRRAEAAGGLPRAQHSRTELEAGRQAALAGGGLGPSHPRLSAEDGQWSPMRSGLRERKSKSEGVTARTTPSHSGERASPGSTSPRTSTMCRGSWLTSAGGCSGSSMAGGAAFSNRSRRAGSFRGDTMEKWIPRCRRGDK